MKQSVHLDCMAANVRMCADVTTIHRVTLNLENVFATKDGEAKTVQNHVKKATMAWVRFILFLLLFASNYSCANLTESFVWF